MVKVKKLEIKDVNLSDCETMCSTEDEIEELIEKMNIFEYNNPNVTVPSMTV